MTPLKVAGFSIALLAAVVFVQFYKTKPVIENAPIFAGVSLTLEYATSSPTRERGLGGRAHIADDYGMLFVFDRSDYHGIWMKDMQVPIDIFWLDDKGQVVSMALAVATSTYPRVFYPIAPARYVLETAAGFGRRNEVATGTPLEADFESIF